MKRNKRKLATQAEPKTTAQQGTDFTAEGAPPPGKVGADAPVGAAERPRSDVKVARQTRATGH